MSKTINHIFFLACITLICNGQNLIVQNPSFEGIPTAHVTPPLWGICMPGVTPDTQPGIWGVSLPPSDGSSYIGMCHEQSGSWQEGASQELLDAVTGNSEPMQTGQTYLFTIDVSDHPTSGGWNVSGPVELLVWGGFSDCDESELLWSSGDVPNFIWTTYNVSFTPSMNFTHIMFQCNALTWPTGYLIIDNMTTINPQCQIVSIENTQGSCNNNEGFIEVTILETPNSTPPYTYLWSNGDTTQNIYNLSPGIYNLEVTDNDGDCISFLSHEIIEIDNPEISALTTPNLCYNDSNGSVNFIIYGGTEPYNIDEFSNLPAGNYTATVTDSNGCEGLVDFYISEPPALEIYINSTPITCVGGNDGSADIIINGGTPPYNNIEDLNNLSAGSYTTTVIDSNGCEETVDFTITEPNIEVYVETNNVTCIGGDDGSANLIITGGSEPYQIEDLDNLSAGSYNTIIIDNNGCETSIDFIITEPTEDISDVITVDYENCILYTNGIVHPGNGTLEIISGPNNLFTYSILENHMQIIVQEYGIYTFMYTGCGKNETFIVTFGCAPKIPNILTLNNDGNNDLFIISFSSISLYSESILTIYNRWGTPLYTASEYGLNGEWWDGRTSHTNEFVTTGTYYYVLELFHKMKMEKEVYSGYIQIINDI